MKVQDYIRENGYQKICEKCNWDLTDIKNHLLRETCIEIGPQLSREMAKLKKFLYKATQKARVSHRIEEIINKLKGGRDDNRNI